MGEEGAGHEGFSLNTSNVGYYDTPDILMSAMEVAFLKAENSLDIEDYKKGINLSLEYYGISSDVVSDYPVFWSELEDDFNMNPKAAILKQKWVGLIGNGPEAYAEVRRNKDLFFGTIFIPGEDYVDKAYKASMGNPLTLEPFEDYWMDKIPYPVSEEATNTENVNAAKSYDQNFWWN